MNKVLSNRQIQIDTLRAKVSVIVGFIESSIPKQPKVNDVLKLEDILKDIDKVFSHPNIETQKVNLFKVYTNWRDHLQIYLKNVVKAA